MESVSEKVDTQRARVMQLEKELEKEREVYDKLLEAAVAYRAVWTGLKREARDCHNRALRAYARHLELEEENKDKVEVDHATCAIVRSSWLAFTQANKSYRTACEKANTYRRKYDVRDSNELTPVSFSGF